MIRGSVARSWSRFFNRDQAAPRAEAADEHANEVPYMEMVAGG